MRNKQYLCLVVISALAMALLTPQGGAYAIGVSEVRFGATCSDFSLAATVTGVGNDGGEFDRFRYLILDGNGKKLYREDAVRRVGVTISSQVINMSYDNDGVDGPPTANPIRLQILDLDANNNVVALLSEQTFNASCLPPASPVTMTENFRPTPFLKAFFIGETPLYRAPSRDPMDLRITAGKEHFAFYRSPDSQWIAIDVSGERLMWVPASVVSVEIGRLGGKPSRIDGSDPATGATAIQPTACWLGADQCALASAQRAINARVDRHHHSAQRGGGCLRAECGRHVHPRGVQRLAGLGLYVLREPD
jgi:hypothetical protein